LIRLSRSRQKTKFRVIAVIVYWLPPVAVTLAFWLLSPNDILWLQLLLAFLLLVMPWVAYLNWKKKSDDKLPIFALFAFMYWVYYALALFWGARTPSGVATPSERSVSDTAISWSLGLAVIGISTLWLGMRTGLGRRLAPRRVPELRAGPRTRHYIRLLLVGGALLSLYDNTPYLAGEGGRQVLSMIITIVPLLAFCILFQKLLKGEAEFIDKMLVLGFFTLRLVSGLSSGWLGSFAAIILICAAMFVAERRRIPRFVVLVVILFTLFFQVGKQDFRKEYWKAEIETSKVDRVKFWTEVSLRKWQEAASDSSGSALAEAINSSLSRVSLLTQTANVIELTPSVVPYQYGQLYSYLLVTWVPRAIWPDKPSMSEANQFYQVAYGMSTQEGLEEISIAVGVLTEAYISFGLFGVVGIMFLMGIFYDVYRNLFFLKGSGFLMTGIGIALLPQMLAIESQMAAYLGGVVQQVVFTLLVFLPVFVWRKPLGRRFRSAFPVRMRSDVQHPDLAADTSAKPA
jgi:hypothetical protein